MNLGGLQEKVLNHYNLSYSKLYSLHLLLLIVLSTCIELVVFIYFGFNCFHLESIKGALKEYKFFKEPIHPHLGSF